MCPPKVCFCFAEPFSASGFLSFAGDPIVIYRYILISIDKSNPSLMKLSQEIINLKSNQAPWLEAMNKTDGAGRKTLTARKSIRSLSL